VFFPHSATVSTSFWSPPQGVSFQICSFRHVPTLIPTSYTTDKVSLVVIFDAFALSIAFNHFWHPSSHFLVDLSCFNRRFLRSRTRYCLENLSQPMHIDFEQFGTRSSHIQPYYLDFRTFGRFWSRSHIRAPDIILKAFCYQSEPISNAFGPFDRISNCSISLFRIFPSLGHIHQSWTIHFVSAGVVVLENVS